MNRAIVLGSVLGSTLLLTSGFVWPPEYADESRADVATCVQYAQQTSPTYYAEVRGVDLTTGHVDIRRIGDARGELAFSKCLLAVRQWRLIERNLPPPVPEPEHAEPATMAGAAASSVVR
ncbi:MAG TPA: hypothetical protein VFE48_08280 [Methylomirabilota bacterium]|nr:hypothetical protein [Methylomirabilota bacterium]